MKTSRAAVTARNALMPVEAGAGDSIVGASTIVVFVTRDPALAAALKEAAPATPILAAASPAQLADVLLSRACGAMLVDVGPLGRGTANVVAHLARQFPDVPVVAVGAARDETSIEPLLASGRVYSFLRQPFVPDRAQAVIEAALKLHRELRPALRARHEHASVAPQPAAPKPAAAPRPPAPAATRGRADPVAKAPAATPAPAPREPIAATAAAAAASSTEASLAAPAIAAPERNKRRGDKEPSKAPAFVLAKHPGGPSPRVIAIGGVLIAVLSVVAWAALKSRTPDPLPEAAGTATALATPPGAHPIVRQDPAAKQKSSPPGKP